MDKLVRFERAINLPAPQEYNRATDQFYALLMELRDVSGFGSTHQAYTMLQGVLLTFRRRLPLPQAIEFAGLLPALTRALFVADWDPHEPVLPFADRETLGAEVKALRAEHNFSTDTAIRDVATALRRQVDPMAFDKLLAKLPEGAVDYWQS